MRLSYRQRVGLSVPSLVLRVLLATIFIWAGLGKVTQRMAVSGQTAADLANMGIIKPVAVNAPASPSKDAPAATPPDQGTPSEPAATPEPETPASEEDGAADGGGAATSDGGMVRGRDWVSRTDLASARRVMPVAWQDSTAPVQDNDADEPADPDSETTANPTKRTPPWQTAPTVTYTAADFPDEVRVRKMWEVALLVQRAAHPVAAEDGSNRVGIWPAPLGSGQWPKWQAIAVAATELGAGVLLVMGLLTRLSALGLMIVTAGAMWLCQIGPAIQAGDAVLGFLPNYPTFDAEAWRPLMLSFALFMAALSLFLGGPGRPSVDHALFRRRVIEEHDGL